MRLLLPLVLLIACAQPLDVGAGTDPIIVADDAGTVQAEGIATMTSGERIFGETSAASTPVLLSSWEEFQAGVWRLGSGRGSTGYGALSTLQLDADDKIGFLLNGQQMIKLQDHPGAGPLWWFGEVEHVWWGNTLLADADLRYQGTNEGLILDPDTGVAPGYHLRITGQSIVGATSAATTIIGGDVRIRGGNASSAHGATLHAGDVVIGGGREGAPVAGNVALHEHPTETGYGAEWCGMEGGVYVRDALAAPTADPTGGGFLYASGGALYWRGSAGTVTQVAAP